MDKRRLTWLSIFVLVGAVYAFNTAPVSALYGTSVKGQMYYSLNVKWLSPWYSNGYEVYVYKEPIYHLQGDTTEWKKCDRLSSHLESQFIEVGNHEVFFNGPFEYLVEKHPWGYKAYIKSKDYLVYVRGYPDFGGVPPSNEKKAICAKKIKDSS